MIKEDFELDPDPSTPGRIVSRFWKDERSYFDGKDKSGFVPDQMDFEAAVYTELVSYKAKSAFDERNSAIEIQIDGPVPLAGNIIAAIMPYEFAKASVVARIEDAGGTVLPFNIVGHNTAENMVSHIYSIVRDLLGGKHGRVRCW